MSGGSSCASAMVTSDSRASVSATVSIRLRIGRPLDHFCYSTAIMSSDVVTIVSGLPRSGTSMMMKMLEAGGLEAVTDNIRTADEDNPKGYYELEKVKEMKGDTS